MKVSRIVHTVSVITLLLFVLWAPAAGDRPPDATPETAGITTSTQIECVGIVMSNADLVWTTSTGVLDGTLAAGESQATVGYTEDTVAVDGYTRYVKEFSVDTANKDATGSNVKSYRQIQYISSGNGGRMTSHETMMMDAAGTASSNGMLCPFSTGGNIPAFCNVVTAGSYMDVEEVSVVTDGSLRAIAANADIPTSLGYHIRAQGIPAPEGHGYAIGSISAFISAHLQEGRGTSAEKALDLAYHEETSASGIIYQFDKTMNYQSGMRRI